MITPESASTPRNVGTVAKAEGCLSEHRGVQRREPGLDRPGSLAMAGPTRLELATSDVTGRRSNQLNYDPANLSSGIYQRTGPVSI
jgi:hypothetical protein